MKKTLFLAVSLIAVLLIGQYVIAADTATVAATVTVQNVSVSVSDGSITYGTIAAGASQSTVALGDTQTATNNGNVTEAFNIRGQNSTNWTLAATAGSDQYIHRFCNDTDLDCATPPTNYTALTSSGYTTLTASVASLGTVNFQLQITTPTVSTVFTQQSVDVTVQAVAL